MACFYNSCSSSLSFLISVLICCNILVVGADPVFVDALCPDKQIVAPSSEYQTNVDSLLSSLSSNTTIWRIFYNTTVGSGVNKVYGAFYCRIDQTIDFCQDCISLAINAINIHCRGKKDSIGWYDQCMVRYSNARFFGILNDSPMLALWNRTNVVDIQDITSNQSGFTQLLRGTLEDVSSQAVASAAGRLFATKEGKFVANLTSMNTVYTLAECTSDMSARDCYTCLQMTVGNVTELCNMKASCTVMCPNCNLWYDIKAFYGDALNPISVPSPAPFVAGTSPRHKKAVVVGVTVSAVFAMVFFLGAWKFACKRKFKNSFKEDDIEIVETLKFDLTTIQKATNNFSAHRKLGEGGFGEVYKGMLENGEYIAIKRLSSNSKQGIGEFKTEVVLVAKLQHRNLVKLLGFCVSGKEKILVYEFLPNMSLDRFLSDPTRRATLNWRTRFKIIGGIARGLLYLHEDSRLKIVHRDLKPSNILLDETMNPKIADFGMAKLFGVDQTQDNTDRIVGTLGYMAPEYLIAGHFSVKSDVYGFGVIVLELVSGLKNKYLRHQQNEDGSLIYRAWRFWNEGTPLKLTDPSFGNDYPVEELSKCIHIGLLCIQDDANKRPPMNSIVAALNGEAITLPSPTLPHFLTGWADREITGSSDQVTCASIVAENITELLPR